MELAMIGLGRMGANLVRRAMEGGHRCVVHDLDAEAVAALEVEGAEALGAIERLPSTLAPPRVVWVMVPAAAAGRLVDEVAHHLEPGDVVIDGGNSHYRVAVDRAERLGPTGVLTVDIGTSGGVHGLDRGFCLMVGGPAEAVPVLEPLLDTLAPGVAAADRTPGSTGPPSSAERGWLHCGPAGAGHFVKMVHNGIEYGMMAALAEGLALLDRARPGPERTGGLDPGSDPTSPGVPPFDFDLAAIAEVWRRGSVISSWLVDLTAEGLRTDPRLEAYEGRVADSGEGRWTVQAALELGVPVPVIAESLFSRFASRGRAELADRSLSLMRAGFGGHLEAPRPAEERGAE